MNIRLPTAPIPENAQGYAEMAVGAVKNFDKLDLDYSVKTLEIVDNILHRFHQEGPAVDKSEEFCSRSAATPERCS